MSPIFGPESNKIFPQSIVIILIIFMTTVWGFTEFYQSDFVTNVNQEIIQPIEFSHKHHVNGLGIDCRFCHTNVEESSTAGMPSTHTCMTCHSQIWRESPALQLVRESYQHNKPLLWNRVHNLPDHVYFDHSIHVQKGVSCTSCHGVVEEMELVRLQQRMTMQWCLDCHRQVEHPSFPKKNLTDCNICHR